MAGRKAWLTDEEREQRKVTNREYAREYYKKNRHDPEWIERHRERSRVSHARRRIPKKDFSDKAFSKWWHDKIDQVRQILNY